MITTYLLIAAFAYLLGSIPFGLLLTRLAGEFLRQVPGGAGALSSAASLPDIRAIGSGNIGATNVLRTGNKGLAAATLLLDGGKGWLAVAWIQGYGHGGVFIAALFVVLGHLFPVWLRFKGGKGVATGFGVFFALAWPVGAISCAVWLGTALFVTGSWKNAALALVIAALVYWKHKANIGRLVQGAEPKIGVKTTA